MSLRSALWTLLALAASTAVLAQPDPRLSIDLPAGDLSVALRELSRSSNVELVYSEADLVGIRTQGAQGLLTAREAVERLLEGTGLQLTVHKTGMLLITGPKPSPLSSAAAEEAARQQRSRGRHTVERRSPARESIDDVTVTANRRSESLNSVPISMTVWSPAMMEALNIRDLADAAPFTSGLNLSDKGNFVALSIRGIGSAGGAPTTGIYIDDTPLQLRTLANSASSQALPSVFDLDRVEILRGPQGTLYGAGSEGGTVRYITRQPSLTTSDAYARTGLSFTQGGASSYEAGFAAGTPVIENELGVRASVWYRKDGGWIDRVDPATYATLNTNNNYEERTSARLAAVWAPGANVTVNTDALYEERRLNDLQTFWASLSDPHRARFVSASPSQAPKQDRFGIVSARVAMDFSGIAFSSHTSALHREDSTGNDGTLTYVSLYESFTQPPYSLPTVGPECTSSGACTSWVDASGLHLPAGLRDYRVHSNLQAQHSGFNQEFRFQSDGAPRAIAWTAGAFFSLEHTSTTQRDADPEVDRFFRAVFGVPECKALAAPCTSDGSTPLVNDELNYYNRQTGRDRQLAAFGEMTWTVAPGWIVTTGLRYSHLTFRSTSQADGPINYGRSDGPRSEETRDSAWTSRATLAYQPSTESLLFGTYSTGVRPGGTNAPLAQPLCTADLTAIGLTTAPSTFGSDEVRSFEIGAKQMYRDRLRVAASVYFIRWHDIQQSITLPTCGSSFTDNVGEAVSKGGDLNVEWAATDSVRLRLATSYMSASYRDSVFAGPGASRPVIKQGADLVLGQGSFAQPLPAWMGAVGGQYDFRMLGNQAFFRIDYQQSSATRDLSAPRVLSGRLGAEVGKVSVALFIDNALGFHEYTSITNTALFATPATPSMNQLLTYSTLPPRTLGLTLTYRE